MKLLYISVFLTYTFDCMLQLPDKEIYLQSGLCFLCLEIRHHDVREHLAKMLHLACLLLLVGLCMQLQQFVLKGLHFVESLHNSHGGVCGSVRLQARGYHVQASGSERLEVVFAVAALAIYRL